MPPKTTPPAPGLSAAPKMPGEVVRGLVSLWLIFHFVGIGLALVTGTSMGRSELLARTKRAPLLYQYLYALWLDTPNSHRLTNGEFDGDYSIEAELVYADGHHSEPLDLTPTDAHGERLERYQALAKSIAPPPEMESPDTRRVSQLGAAMLRKLKEEGVTEVTFRVRRHAPLSMSDAVSSDPGQRNPAAPRTITTLFTASVTLNSSDEPQVQVKSQSARDVAPVTNPATQPNRQPGANAPSQTTPSLPPALRSPAINLDERVPSTVPSNTLPGSSNPATSNK